MHQEALASQKFTEAQIAERIKSERRIQQSDRQRQLAQAYFAKAEEKYPQGTERWNKRKATGTMPMTTLRSSSKVSSRSPKTSSEKK